MFRNLIKNQKGDIDIIVIIAVFIFISGFLYIYSTAMQFSNRQIRDIKRESMYSLEAANQVTNTRQEEIGEAYSLFEPGFLDNQQTLNIDEAIKMFYVTLKLNTGKKVSDIKGNVLFFSALTYNESTDNYRVEIYDREGIKQEEQNIRDTQEFLDYLNNKIASIKGANVSFKNDTIGPLSKRSYLSVCMDTKLKKLMASSSDYIITSLKEITKVRER